MKHTPTPWAQHDIYPWEIWHGADYHIADVHGREEIRKANADHIVHCVNLHDELIEALEKLARLENGDSYGNSIGNRIAQEVLAKAKGGE